MIVRVQDGDVQLWHSGDQPGRRLAAVQLVRNGVALAQSLVEWRRSNRAVATGRFCTTAAEALDIGVPHHDVDFDLIASVTGQRFTWVLPAGSVD